MSESDKQIALIPLQHTALTKVGAKSLVARGHLELRNNEEAGAWLNKGMASYRQQRYDDVLRCFQLGIQLNPNHPVLLQNLGSLYYEDYCGMKDDVEAAKWFRKAAEQGCIDAQSQLGLCYSYGIGVPIDHVEAAVWWKKAAEQGHIGAQSVLAGFYDEGKGVPQDYWQAAFWYLKAAEQGHEEAKDDLDSMRGRECKPYNNSLQKWMSFQTYCGYSVREFTQALTEFEQRQAKAATEAEQGDVDAQYSLGVRYHEGQGVNQDYAQAALWWRKAAERGYANAQYALGFLYRYGQGVIQDYDQAAQWYRKAAEQGDEDANDALTDMQMQDSELLNNRQKKWRSAIGDCAQWYRKPAE